MIPQQLRKLPLRWKLGGLAAVGLLIALVAWIVYWRSPLSILHLTLAALERRDAAALVELASEKEVRTMNLTPQNVEACLRETSWRDNPNRLVIRVKHARQIHANDVAYYIDMYGFTSDGKPRESTITIYHGPSGRWRLLLGGMLYLMTRDCLGIKGDHAPVWDAMARRHGIVGVVGPDGRVRYVASGTHGNKARFKV